MAFGLVPLEKRLKDNIKNYSLDQLFDIANLSDFFEAIYRLENVSFLLTDRHGEKAICYGDFIGYEPDVVNTPGLKIKICGRTVAHLYIKEEGSEEICETLSDTNKDKLIKAIVTNMQREGNKAFEAMETSIYSDELEKLLEKEQYQVKHGEKNDPLTGVLNSTYFDNRMKVLDRSQTVPVGVVCANINDWKYANDTYGDEESDRLIQIVANILKQEAKPEYIIGRCGGDFFYILIPMAEDGETEEYMAKIQQKCNSYEDDKLAPSIACGMVIRTNVEENLSELLSDAEYEMFDNKFEVKNAPGYKERLMK